MLQSQRVCSRWLSGVAPQSAYRHRHREAKHAPDCRALDDRPAALPSTRLGDPAPAGSAVSPEPSGGLPVLTPLHPGSASLPPPIRQRRRKRLTQHQQKGQRCLPSYRRARSQCQARQRFVRGGRYSARADRASRCRAADDEEGPAQATATPRRRVGRVCRVGCCSAAPLLASGRCSTTSSP